MCGRAMLFFGWFWQTNIKTEVWWHDESLQVQIELKGRKVLKHFALNGTVIIIKR